MPRCSQTSCSFSSIQSGLGSEAPGEAFRSSGFQKRSCPGNRGELLWFLPIHCTQVTTRRLGGLAAASTASLTVSQTLQDHLPYPIPLRARALFCGMAIGLYQKKQILLSAQLTCAITVEGTPHTSEDGTMARKTVEKCTVPTWAGSQEKHTPAALATGMDGEGTWPLLFWAVIRSRERTEQVAHSYRTMTRSRTSMAGCLHKCQPTSGAS